MLRGIMSEQTKPKPQPPGSGWVLPEHFENREKFPAEELAKYYGKCVAWNRDGTQILASGDDHDQLFDRIEELGLPGGSFVVSVIDPFAAPSSASAAACSSSQPIPTATAKRSCLK
jgi:hypothetical protein